MQIKADLFHVFLIELWLRLQEGNICLCIIALQYELLLSF